MSLFSNEQITTVHQARKWSFSLFGRRTIPLIEIPFQIGSPPNKIVTELFSIKVSQRDLEFLRSKLFGRFNDFYFSFLFLI